MLNNNKNIDRLQKLNRNSKIPLYKQLYLELKKLIESPNSKLREFFYSEKELIEMYDVSRITVRSALKMLEDEGFISRSQGSTSVVVNQSKYSWNLHDVLEDLKHFEHLLETEVKSIDKVVPNDRILRKLNLDPETKSVYRVERVRSVKNEKLARSISYLIPSVEIAEEDLNEENKYSITALLRENGENPYYAEETIEAINGDKNTCEVLGLPENTAVFLRERITYDYMDNPLEFVISHYNSQNTKYYIKDKLL